jgi:uncharacterized LabA/DUF88 family protein
MPTEPIAKRTIAFVDGQNLYHAAKEAFGHTYPNYDALALTKAICTSKGWSLVQTRFYTGIPDAADNPFWNAFWVNKLGEMGRQGVWVFQRPLRYRNQVVRLPDGSSMTSLAGEEKGIDVRIALDVIRMAHHGEFDVALVFSQDQDLSEVAREVRAIAIEQGRWIKIASAFPVGPATRNRRGIDRTDWIAIDRATYDACVDPYDYRAKRALRPAR